jgi:sulfite exporter TauE/SafE
LPFKVSTTTSNFMIGVTAAASAGIYLSRGYIDPGLALPVMLGVLAGAVVGSRLLAAVQVRALRVLSSNASRRSLFCAGRNTRGLTENSVHVYVPYHQVGSTPGGTGSASQLVQKSSRCCGRRNPPELRARPFRASRALTRGAGGWSGKKVPRP